MGEITKLKGFFLRDAKGKIVGAATRPSVVSVSIFVLFFSTKEQDLSAVRLVLPLTNLDRLYAACESPSARGICGKGFAMGRLVSGPPLSPFHLAIDWENWDSVAVLAARLDSSRFRLPVYECRMHGDYCLSITLEDNEEDDDVAARDEADGHKTARVAADRDEAATDNAIRTEAERDVAAGDGLATDETERNMTARYVFTKDNNAMD